MDGGTVLPRICCRIGYGICPVQELLGHKKVSTPMIYTRMLNKAGLSIQSPFDHQPPTGKRPPPLNYVDKCSPNSR